MLTAQEHDIIRKFLKRPYQSLTPKFYSSDACKSLVEKKIIREESGVNTCYISKYHDYWDEVLEEHPGIDKVYEQDFRRKNKHFMKELTRSVKRIGDKDKIYHNRKSIEDDGFYWNDVHRSIKTGSISRGYRWQYA